MTSENRYGIIHYWLKSLRGSVLGIVIGIILLAGGYVLFDDGLGLAAFMALPFTIGFSVVNIVRFWWCAVVVGVLVYLATFSILLAADWEGAAFHVLALPMEFTSLSLGIAVGYGVRLWYVERARAPRVMSMGMVLLSSVLAAVADHVERPFRRVCIVGDLVGTETVPLSQKSAWEAVLEMRGLDQPPPDFLRGWIPIPTDCDLDRHELGGTRTCRFTRGVIAEEVTNWEPFSSVDLRVTKNTLPTRSWLTHVNTHYRFSPVEGGTMVVREMTIASRLYPRSYWLSLERHAFEAQHAFLMNHLVR